MDRRQAEILPAWTRRNGPADNLRASAGARPQTPATRRTARWLGIAVAALVVGAVLAAVGYDLFQAARLAPLDSDVVQSFLEAGSILRGNVLLAGWHLAADNFYFTDTLPFAGFALVFGRRLAALTIIPLAVYLLIVGVGMWLACSGVRSLRDRILAFAVVLFLVGLPPMSTHFILLTPDIHMASILFSLAAFGALAWFRQAQGARARALGAVAFFVLAGAAAASDPFVIAFALLPALLVLVAEWLGSDSRGRGVIVPLLLVLAAVAAGLVIPRLVARFGGFVIEPTVRSRFIAADHLGRTFIALLFDLLHLGGADFFGQRLASVGGIASLARLAGLAVALVALVWTLRRAAWRDKAGFLDRWLATSIIVLGLICVSSQMFDLSINGGIFQSNASERYTVPMLIFAAVLAGRRVPEMVRELATRRLRAASIAAVLAFSLALLAGHTWQAARTAGVPSWAEANPPTTVAAWLTKNGLTRGTGGYWAANLVMAMGDGTLRIRPLAFSHGRLVPRLWITNARWRDAAEAPSFVIWQQIAPGTSHISPRTVAATWGRPERIEHIGGFDIAVLAAPPRR
ncbi:MAG: hypothetical protein ACREFZ_02165 [Acetobacteraceae bacterium]